MRDISHYSKSLSKAIDRELHRKLAYGCVNLWSSGSHKDMDYELFIRSKNSIINSFKATDWENIDDFHMLRRAGLEVENRMFEATKGVNTHKGLIFLHMFLAKAFVDGINWSDMNTYIKDFARPLANDYKKEAKAKIWNAKGLEDIRQFPMTGFAYLTDMVDKMPTKNLSDNYLSLYLIAHTDDTTTFQRSNLETLRTLQAKARAILEIKDEEAFYRESGKLNNFYQAKNISSGGVADLFTTIRTLEFLREDFND